MAHFYRLIIGALLLLCSQLVLAGFAPYTTTFYQNSAGPQQYETALAACAALGGNTLGSWSANQAWCYDGDKYRGIISRFNRTGCPNNSTLINGVCQCEAEHFERAGSAGTICVKPDERTPEQFCEDWAAIYNSTLTGSRFARAPGLLSAWADGAMTCREPNEQDGLPEGTGCKHWFTGDLSFQDDAGQWQTNGYSATDRHRPEMTDHQ